MTPTLDEVARPTPRQTLFDVVLALGCTALALLVGLTGIEAVPANRPVGPDLVVLTVLAVAPVAWRGRRPLSVLVVTLLAVLTMVVTRTTVGLSTLGPLIAVYTAVAYGTRARAHLATGILIAAFAVAAALGPVDLSVEGAVVHVTVFVCGWLLATATRTRRERFAAGLARLEDEAAHERVRAEAERERAGRVATEERLRISRDVHDIVGHALSVMIVQATVAEQLLDSQPERARHAVAEIGRTGRASLADIRRLLDVLHAAEPDSPGGAGLGSPTLDDLPALTDGVRAAGLPVEVSGAGDLGDVPAGVGLAAYRVVQEALTNSLRHAGAGSAVVRVRRHAGALVVEVEDDGTPSGALVTSGAGGLGEDAFVSGHGLAGMRERVRVYAGTLTVDRGPRGGTQVRAVFPISMAVGALP
jgi:signal transduction histidine kinase